LALLGWNGSLASWPQPEQVALNISRSRRPDESSPYDPELE
jgi:hypothetical protein